MGVITDLRRRMLLDGYSKSEIFFRIRATVRDNWNYQQGNAKWRLAGLARVREVIKYRKSIGKKIAAAIHNGDARELDCIFVAIVGKSFCKNAMNGVRRKVSCRPCDYCGNSRFSLKTIDRSKICSRCLDSNEILTASCGHRTLRETSVCIHAMTLNADGSISLSVWSWENRTFCQKCTCSRLENRDENTGTSRCDYIWERDGKYHNMPEPDQVVGRYHSTKGKIQRIGKTIPGMPDIGFELEWGPKERNESARDEISLKLKNLDHIVAGVEEDGSIRGIMGAEIVTHYGSLDEILSGAEDICKVLSGVAISHSTECCGLHVSISRQGLTNIDIARFVVFWNSQKNRRFLRAFARRWGNGYCIKNIDKGSAKIDNTVPGGYIPSHLFCSESRYEIINLTNRERIEVRAFRGTTNRDTLRRCVSLCAWLFAWIMKSPAAIMHYSHFLKWCSTARIMRGRRKFKPIEIYRFSAERGFVATPEAAPQQAQAQVVTPIDGVISSASEPEAINRSLENDIFESLIHITIASEQSASVQL